MEGSAGSGNPGNGPVYKQKKAYADDLEAQLKAARAQLDSAIKTATSRLADAGSAEKQSAAAELATDRTKLGQLTAEKKKESDEFTAHSRNDRGLLAQLNALSKLTGSNPTLKTAYLTLLLFITAIEILPVLTKFLLNLGPPSLYDQILARAEASDVETAAASLEYERNLTVQELEVRGARETEAVRGLVEKLVAAEVEIYDEAIDQWRADQRGQARPGSRPERATGGGIAGVLGSLRRTRSGAPRPRQRADADYAEWPDEEPSQSPGGYAPAEADTTQQTWGYQ